MESPQTVRCLSFTNGRTAERWGGFAWATCPRSLYRHR